MSSDNSNCSNMSSKNSKDNDSSSSDESNKEKKVYICTSIRMDGTKCVNHALKKNKYFCLCHVNPMTQKKIGQMSLMRSEEKFQTELKEKDKKILELEEELKQKEIDFRLLKNKNKNKKKNKNLKKFLKLMNFIFYLIVFIYFIKLYYYNNYYREIDFQLLDKKENKYDNVLCNENISCFDF